MKMKYGAEQVKYKQMYDKLYYLTKGKPVAQANAKPSVPKIQVLEDDELKYLTTESTEKKTPSFKMT